MKLAAVILLSAVCWSQAPPPAPCPASRPVDDMIAQVHQQHSKRKNRNKDPFPDVTCIWGWCRQGKSKSPAPSEPAPKKDQPQANASESSSSRSSSEPAVNPCDIEMEQALEAAHNVDVGDYYFEQHNFRAALMRYQDAGQQKPRDIAIEVRQARAYEKLGDQPSAIEHYKNASQLDGPEKWKQEADSALQRLAH